MSACIACRQSAQHRSGTSSTYSYPSLQFFAFAFPLKLFQVINIKHMRTHSSLLYFRVYFHFNEDICMCKYKFTHCSLCGGATADRWYLVCVCWCWANVPYCRWQGVFCAHIYCLFNLSERFSLSQHNAIASVVRRCYSRKRFSRCSMSSVWAIRIFLSLLPIGVEGVGGIWGAGGWCLEANALCLKSYRERCARSKRLHKAFNLLSLSNCMSANILWLVSGLSDLCPSFCLLFSLSAPVFVGR